MKIVLFIVSCLLFQSSSNCQSVSNNSLEELQIKNALNLYNRYTDGNAPIFNGTAYIYFTFQKEGDPFFVSSVPSNGWIGYEGRVSEPVSMFFDITRNQLVLLNADSVSNIVLHNELIDSFYLWGHTFISLKEDPKKNLYNTGFYDRLYNGHIQLVARRMKTMDNNIEGNMIIRVFSSKNRYYIFKDSLYYQVTNKKEVFRLVADKKHEIRRMMRKEHLNFRRDNFENTLVKVTAFYDQLIH